MNSFFELKPSDEVPGTFMSKLENLWYNGLQSLDALLSLSSALQFFLVVVAFAIAMMVNRKLHKRITGLLGNEEKATLKILIVRGFQRLIMPVVMLSIIVLLQVISIALEQPVWLFDIVIPLLLSLAAIRIAVFLLRCAYTPSSLVKAWENIISTSIWVIVALHLLGILPGITAFLDGLALGVGERRISILDVIQASISVLVFLILASWLSRVVERKVMSSEYLGISMRMALSKTIKIGLLSLAILVALNSVGIDLTALTVFGGAFGVGLGLGLQRIASNFMSGMILLYDRSIRPGDVITIGNRFGWVQELRARYIVVRDRDGVETLIPNENLITSEVTNWSYSDKAVRLKVPVTISYKDDPEQAMEIMRAACKQSRVLDDPPVATRLMGFGDSGIDLEARVWISDPQTGVNNIRSDINLAIWKGFRQVGITIPYPQREIRMLS